jgi:cytochrome c oxidase subunit 1
LGGKLSLNTSLLFGIGFLSSFLIGGLTGIMLASVPFDIHVHDTYFVVGHFHYVLFGGTAMALFPAVYHWFPKMTGRMYNETLGRIHFVLSFIGLNLTFMPMHELGLLGMNRRIALYDVQFQDLNVLSTAGAYILGISSIPFAINMVWSAFKGQPAGRNPWRALTLEWQTSSPQLSRISRKCRFFGLAPTITVLIWKNRKQRNQYKISSLKWALNPNN